MKAKVCKTLIRYTIVRKQKFLLGGSCIWLSRPKGSRYSCSVLLFAFEYLGKQKGYSLIGSNSAGNNLFFVRNDRLGSLKPLKAQEAFVKSRIREARDPEGKLSYLSGDARVKAIKDMYVVAVDRNKLILLYELLSE